MNSIAKFFALNTELFTYVNNYGASSWIGKVSVFFSFFVMYGLIALAVLVPLIFFFKEHDTKLKLHFLKLWLLYVSVGLATWVIGESIKLLIQIPRPYEAIITLQPLITAGAHNSFPSLHSALAIAIASVSAVWSKSLSELLYVVAVLIMISRILVGVHYPLDIVCGAVLGFAIAHVGKQLYRKYA